MGCHMDSNELDITKIKECAEAFSESVGLSISIDDLTGQSLYCCGSGCSSCKIKALVKEESASCVDTHLYGLIQAERFGGKYIYFCPSGLSFIISPIFNEDGVAAGYVKGGPFLMVDKDDYIRYDLTELMKIPQELLTDAESLLDEIPYISPERVNKLSTLLHMSIGYVNNVSVGVYQEKKKNSDDIQGHISELLKNLKAQSSDIDISYPFDKEMELIAAIKDGDKSTSNRLLNDILGYIFFCSGGNFNIIRTRVVELLVLFSRAAVEGGADERSIFSMSVKYFEQANNINDLDELCLWLSKIMNELSDYVFRFNNVKHVDIIRKAVDYIRRNFTKKISLEDVADSVYLSPSYFSKIFKDEMDINFNSYLNKIRIDKAKQLLKNNSISLVDISGLVGFEDQSYFSKVFKKVTGETPGKFRNAGGKTTNGRN